MKKITVITTAIILLAALAATATAAKPTKVVYVYVVDPATATTTVTPEQAEAAANKWMGEINSWLQREIGRVLDWEVRHVQVPRVDSETQRDSCGSYSYPGLLLWMNRQGFTDERDRFIYLLMGGGGWAGHYFTAKGNRSSSMVGDWGVQQEEGLLTPCTPTLDDPNRGFSHELMGTLGMYWTDGYSGALFVGDTMTEGNKRDLLRYSGAWLR